jgi:L-seryl-tRNA(Ser) seleniumtransferase
MSIYESLGVRPLINASATLTRLGGSIMAPEVVQAMVEAACHFVDLNDLQRKVGERIAALTHNEAAYVSSGAAAGLVLATAACITGNDPALVHRLPNLNGLKNEVIIHKTQRNVYDYAVQQVGVKVIEIGSAEGTTGDDLINAISDQTAVIFWFQGAMTTPGDVPLPEVIKIAKSHSVPVVVDAAAQLPPVSNLWDFTAMGVDLAIFSGGKDLRGPQSSGLILGRRDLIEACRINANPNPAIGRPMKVGKEEMLGLLAAVERYLKLDHDARAEYCESAVGFWNEALNNINGVSAERDFPNEAGQPLPRTLITVNADVIGLTHEDIVRELADGDPAITVLQPEDDSGIYLNPMTLEPGEERIVLKRLLEIFQPG